VADLTLLAPLLRGVEINAHRETALQQHAKPGQYALLSSGTRQVTAVELCLSAARIQRFDTLTSHLRELELTDE